MFAWGGIKGNSVLPSLFISCLASSMFFAAVPNFLMEKSCTPAATDSLCNNTDLVIKATQMATQRNILRSIMPTLCVPLFAHWRDRTGSSKPLVIVGMVAETVAAIIYLISSILWSLSIKFTAIMEAVIGGLFGEIIYLMGASCIIIDNSTSENRTMRLQMLLSTLFVANFLASAIYGFILSRSGYISFYSIVIGLHILAITLAITLVVDKKRETTDRRKNGICQNMKIVFQKRRNGVVLWTMMVCTALVESYSEAETNVIVYYLHQKFEVTVIEEGLIDAYYALVLAIGSLVFPYIFSKLFQWTDYKIGIVSAMATTLFQAARVFVETRVELYLVVFLGLLKCVLLSIPQSIISKNVKDCELGQFLGMSAIIKSCITAPIYRWYEDVFNKTWKIYPGLFFGIGSFVNFIVMILLSICSFLARPPDNEEETDAKECDESTSSTKRIDLWVIHKNHK